MFKHVLVPLDLSAKSGRAVAAALQLVTHGHARVTLLHVIQRIEHIPESEMRTFYDRLQNRAAQTLRRAASAFARRGLRVREVVLLGSPPDDIVQYAAAKKVDLIVMSSHEVRSLTRPGQGLGTTSYKVAIMCRCPVLLVK
jgi:nucleotide-binding universal stress UspA family protein